MKRVSLSLLPLETAFARFDKFSKHLGSEQEKAGAVQAFEYTFELCWKAMKIWLESKGLTAQSPKETFRLAAMNGLIEEIEPWFEFIELRNLSVHTYQEKTLEKVVAGFPKFHREVSTLIPRLHAEQTKP